MQEAWKEKILEGTIAVYGKKGLKFTMDDLAAELGMSKKSIYATYRNKEDLFLHMVDMIFDHIKESERAILEDESLPTLEKVHRILGVLPAGYRDIDFSQLYDLKDRFPQIYERVRVRLESDWDVTLSLIRKGIDEGVIRPVSLPVVKIMLESTLEKFFQSDVLVRNRISYADALQEAVDVIVYGISVR